MMTSSQITIPSMGLKVPVAELEIVNGPTKGHWNGHRANLRQHWVHYIDLQLTLRTPASEETFKRMLRCFEITERDDGTFIFDAMMSGIHVLGMYDLATRTGKVVPHSVVPSTGGLQYDPVVALADKIFHGESAVDRAALTERLRASAQSGLECLDAVHAHVTEMHFGLNGRTRFDNETIALHATTVPLDEVDDIIEEAIEDLRAEWSHVLH